MASQSELLSIAGQAPTALKNDAKDAGGVKNTFSTAEYANFRFDASAGVKPDTTIRKDAQVGPEAPNAVPADQPTDEEENPIATKKKTVSEAASSVTGEELDGDGGTDSNDEDDEDFDLDDLDLDEEEVVGMAGGGTGTKIKEPLEGSALAIDGGGPVGEVDASVGEGSADDEINPKKTVTEGICSFCGGSGMDEDGEPCSHCDGGEALPDDLPDLEEAANYVFPSERKPVKESKIKVSLKVGNVAKLFENNTTLTKEDKRHSRALFEAAVKSTSKNVAKQLNEAYKKRYENRMKVHEAKVVKQVDAYLAFATEQWMLENKVPLQSQIRSKLTENFVKGLKTLFTENYVDIPESKVNVVAQLSKNLKTVKTRLAEAEASKVRIHAESKAAVAKVTASMRAEHKARLIAEAASTMVASERGKFATQAKSLPFKSSDTFRKDLVALRESYLGAVPTNAGERQSDQPVAKPLFETATTPRTDVDIYVKAATRMSTAKS